MAEAGGGSELTTAALGMSLAPCPDSCRQTRCLFCCFIALLSSENWSSESWERQHLVGTGKEAYLQSPPPADTPGRPPPHDRCREGVWVSVQSPS